MRNSLLLILFYILFSSHVLGNNTQVADTISKISFHLLDLTNCSYGLTPTEYIYENKVGDLLSLTKHTKDSALQCAQSISNNKLCEAFHMLEKSVKESISISNEDLTELKELLVIQSLSQEAKKMIENIVCNIDTMSSDTICLWLSKIHRPSGRVYIEISMNSAKILIRPMAHCDGIYWELVQGDCSKTINYKDVLSFLLPFFGTIDQIFGCRVSDGIYDYVNFRLNSDS